MLILSTGTFAKTGDAATYLCTSPSKYTTPLIGQCDRGAKNHPDLIIFILLSGTSSPGRISVSIGHVDRLFAVLKELNLNVNYIKALDALRRAKDHEAAPFCHYQSKLKLKWTVTSCLVYKLSI